MKDLILYIFLSIPLIGAFVMFALGISVIYRASRVLNLAHGAMAMLPAYVAYSLTKAGVPTFVALPAAILTGALLGVGVERVFVRRLRPQGSTAQTVGTVAVAGLIIAFTAKIWGTTPIIAPGVFPEGTLRIAGVGVRWGDIGLFATGLAVAAGLTAFFKLSDFGLAMRGAAENRRAAALLGINPNTAAAAAWALGGGLAALAGVLLAAVTNLDPYNLTLQVLPAFVAVLIGRLESLPGAVGGSVIAGLAFGLAPGMAKIPGLNVILGNQGAPQLVLTILALVVMALRGAKLKGAEEAGGPIATAAFRRAKKRGLRPGVVVGIAFVILFPFVAPFSFVGDALRAMQLAVIATSLVVLIGWVGQISLAQASFVGISAFITGMVTRGIGLEFPFNVVIGAAAAAAAAVILGVVALRVRGLYLAVATLIFAWMADKFLFTSPWLGAAGGSSTIPGQRIGIEGASPALDLTSRKTLYFVLLAVLVLVIASLANLRDTKVGRAFFAVRGSEMAAASLGIDVVRYKLVAFGLSGLVAGIGGGLLMTEQLTVVPAQFLFTMSLQFLAIAVVGGLSSLGGAIAAGVVFAALDEVFFSVRALAGWLEVVSAGLLAFVLLVYPGGLSAAGQRITAAVGKMRAKSTKRGAAKGPVAEPVTVEARPRRRVQPMEPVSRAIRAVARPVAGLLERRRSQGVEVQTAPSEDWLALARAKATNGNGSNPEPDLPLVELAEHAEHAAPVLARAHTHVKLPEDRDDRRPLVEADGIVVQFGGLRAVSEASLSVREGEIVGLIGPNGAGKTTLFNAILGMNSPTGGRIRLYGKDVTSLRAHQRARMGVGRTFQVLQLFSELSVFDNLLVATHLHNGSTLISNLAASAATIQAEADARSRVHDVLQLLGLDDIAHESVRGLPFGVLRMVELGRALVTGARVLMLDEIASGLNDSETKQLAKLIKDVRNLGVSILLIEHDVHMVVSVSDYMYVLEQGRMIAEGKPADVQRDPQVIAAYLGNASVEAEPVGV